MGGSTRIEYELDDTKNYFPVLYTENGYDIQYEVNICNPRCDTCNDFSYNSCLTCKTATNILAAPSC